RILLGGSGTMMGVSVALSSAIIGVVARARLDPENRPPSPARLYVFGLAVHLAMLCMTVFVPDRGGLLVLRRIGIPIIVLYPLATILAGKILSDQAEARRALQTLRASEERFKLSMEASNGGLWDLDVRTDRAYYNPAYCRILGYEPGEFPALGSSWSSLVHPEDRERVMAGNRNCIEGGRDFLETEFRMIAKDDGVRWIYSRGKVIARDESGRALRMIGTHVDITDRKRIEEELKRNVEEKELLLREVHHRVKNNLSIISSLLNLQASMIKTPEQALAAFQNSIERIQAMSLVHEELYKSMDHSRVNMEEYVGKLVAQLALAYGEDRVIALTRRIEKMELDVSTSIPCGLILNELITNAYKHAFPEGRAGTILIDLGITPEGFVEMRVSDDGIGMPAGIDLESSDSLGLTLVRLLVDQLRGTLRMSAGHGTVFSIRFPARGPASGPGGYHA
ncbi:MAG TPA: PAS domain-containing protein, partial [Magnetospirillaceae bacterium]|nr:PAS domain-containing protein [Magnetospirillaceae bacterium]